MTDINAWIVQSWQQYQALVIVAAGALGLAVLVGAVIYAKASGKRIRPAVVWLASNLALLLNAEGMWKIATGTLHLPVGFAVLVFAVFEVTLTTAMALASERYHATTERAPDGLDGKPGKIIKPGHPGKMLYVVWLIALTSALVVATNAPTRTEQLLRLALPVIIVLMWWATLTAEGQTVRRSRFAHSPMRLMERYGWLTPDDDPDYERMARNRKVRAMVTYGHRLETGLWGARWHEWRLTRLARGADEAMAIEVAEQLDRVSGIVNRVVPSRRKRVTAELSDSRPTKPIDDAVRHNGYAITARAVSPVGHHRSVADVVTDRLTDAVTDRLTDRPLTDDRPTPVTESVTEVTGELPVIPSVSEDALRDLARDAYRASVAAGRPLSGADLARKFGQDNPRWGTRRIAEVRAESAPDAQ